MVYVWKCKDCEHENEVIRSLADIDVGPDCCDACDSKKLRRVVVLNSSGTKGFVLEGTGWHATDYSKTRSYR